LLNKLGCKQINFTGGEALIKNGFFKILAYSKKKKISNNLFTNGTQISKENVNKIKNYISYIGVSIEGMEKENDFIRGQGSYKKTISCLALLNKNKIPFGAYLTLNKTNVKHLEIILKKIKAFDPFNISINEIVLRGRARKNKMRLYKKINKKEIFDFLKRIFPNERFKLEEGCTANPRNIFLTSEGKIYLCTEIQQCNKKKYLGSLIPFKFNTAPLLNKFSKINLHKECPYAAYISKHITLNFLTGKKCPYLK
jgi:MoaA/NifB/PqqE/SkfB family radical SAM enzyme